MSKDMGKVEDCWFTKKRTEGYILATVVTIIAACLINLVIYITPSPSPTVSPTGPVVKEVIKNKDKFISIITDGEKYVSHKEDGKGCWYDEDGKRLYHITLFYGISCEKLNNLLKAHRIKTKILEGLK